MRPYTQEELSFLERLERAIAGQGGRLTSEPLEAPGMVRVEGTDGQGRTRSIEILITDGGYAHLLTRSGPKMPQDLMRMLLYKDRRTA